MFAIENANPIYKLMKFAYLFVCLLFLYAYCHFQQWHGGDEKKDDRDDKEQRSAVSKRYVWKWNFIEMSISHVDAALN